MSTHPSSISLFSHTVAPRPAALASLGNLLEMQVLWPHPRPAESDTLGAGEQWVQEALQGILRHLNMENYGSVNCHVSLFISQLSCKPLESWNVVLQLH